MNGQRDAGTPTVVVADDHVPMRDAISAVLEAHGFRVVGSANDADGAIELARRHRPDVCLLDISMPGNGIEAARAVSAEVPETTVVMLTVLVDDDSLFDALRAGARGYLIKGTEPAEMIEALRGALLGEPALSEGLSMRLLEAFARNDSRRVHVPGRGFVQLSPREAEVLDMLRQGMTTSAIGRRLCISSVTVRTHVSALLRKLDASNREEALSLFQS
jgi:DNA-binding NarL/FixJ family response regulator